MLFGGVALAHARARADALARRAFVAAMALTALWALAVAGIEARDVSVRIAEALRNAGWLIFMMALVGRGRRSGYGVAAIYCVVMLLVVAGAVLAIVETLVQAPREVATLIATRLLLRIMAALSALVLVHQLAGGGAGARRAEAGRCRDSAALWGMELLVACVAYAGFGWPLGLVAARGFAMAAVALVLGVAAAPARRVDARHVAHRCAALRSPRWRWRCTPAASRWRRGWSMPPAASMRG